MKISIDLDGTLYFKLDFFREMITKLQDNHEVGILTGHSQESWQRDIEKLNSLGVYPVFYLGRTAEYIPFNGAKFKIDMIRLHNIDIHFDDFDYNNPETIRLFDDPSATDIRHRIIKVECAGRELNDPRTRGVK